MNQKITFNVAFTVSGNGITEKDITHDVLAFLTNMDPEGWGAFDAEIDKAKVTNLKITRDPKAIAVARRLLSDKRAAGDHDFTDESLKVWKQQRAAIQRSLKKFIEGKTNPVTPSDRKKINTCPRMISWDGGTDEGAAWIEDCEILLGF